MSEKSVILLEDIISSQADTESAVRAAVSPSTFDAPYKNFAGERGKECPVGGPKGPAEDECEAEAGAKADVVDEDVDDVCGVQEVGVSGYESEGSTLSENLRRERMSKRRVSEGFVDNSHLPQCEFSNLQHLPLTFLLEFLCWPINELY